MPAVYERTFRIRYDECDAYGHVNHDNYLRFMQEAAFDASAKFGYDFDTYRSMNRHWLIRETDITFHHPLKYADNITVKTWVADFRRVRSRRMYEMRLQGTGEIVANAFTDWVFLNTIDMRPARIPGEMISAFFPDGPPSSSIKRHPFPEPPPPPPGVFQNRRRVIWRDLDGANHVNNAVYLSYFEDCAVEMVRQKKWPMERMIAAGFGIIAQNFRIEYKQPALMDDELELSTWVSDVKRDTAVRHYTIHRQMDQQLLARARALLVWIDLKNGRPMRIPAGFLADISSNIAW